MDMYLSPHFLTQLMRYSETFLTLSRSEWRQLCRRGKRDWRREQETWSRALLEVAESRQLSSDSERMRSTRLISSSEHSFNTNCSVRFCRDTQNTILHNHSQYKLKNIQSVAKHCSFRHLDHYKWHLGLVNNITTYKGDIFYNRNYIFLEFSLKLY